MMAKPSTRSAGISNSRKQILDIAAKLFSQRSYNGTPLRDIAAAANMKAGSLYYHFDSKEQLILEVLQIGISNIRESAVKNVEALPVESTCREKLIAAAKGHLEALLEKGDYASTSIRNYRQIPDTIQDVVIETRNSYEDLWRKWLAEGQEKGEIKADTNLKILRLTILSSLNRVLEWYSEGEELTVHQIAETQIGFFWDGVGVKVSDTDNNG